MVGIAKFMSFILLLAMLGAGAAGCSMLDKVGLGKEGGASAKSGAKETVYYTGTANVPLYRSPGSDIISRLPRYAKLYRDDLQRGYAHVRVDATGAIGWVDNAQLIWRLPAQPAEPASAPSATEPGPEPIKSPESTTPAATPSSGTPSQPTVAPSIFNPY